MGFLVTLIVLVAVLWVMMAAAGALPILMLSRVRLTSVEEEKSRQLLRTVLTTMSPEPGWFGENGFRPIGVFQITGQIGDPYMVAWQREGEDTYLCVYVIQGEPKAIDILTMFDNGGLTTGSTKDGHAVPPRPNRWVQSFSPVSVADQYRHHEAALTYLREATGQTPRRMDEESDFGELFVSNVRAHATYIRSLPLWFLRIPNWYLVRRKRLHNKTIREQLEQKRADLRQFTAE